MAIGKLIELPKIVDPRGNLTVAEPQSGLPFSIARSYWVYDVPGGESRGGHAHRECQELIIALSGSFNVTLDDAHGTVETHHLNHPYQALLVPTGVWRTLDDFSSGSVCMVLASHEFDEADYVRSYDEFLQIYG